MQYFYKRPVFNLNMRIVIAQLLPASSLCRKSSLRWCCIQLPYFSRVELLLYVRLQYSEGGAGEGHFLKRI